MAEQPERLRDEQGMVPKIAPRVQWGTEAGLPHQLHRCECDQLALCQAKSHGRLSRPWLPQTSESDNPLNG